MHIIFCKSYTGEWKKKHYTVAHTHNNKWMHNERPDGDDDDDDGGDDVRSQVR